MGKLAKVLGKINEALDMREAARMQRAKDAGFDTSQTYYHGASRGGYNVTSDIKSFDPDKVGDKWGQDRDGFFFTTNPDEANYYATTNGVGENVDGGAVYPTLQRSDNPLVIDSTDDIDLAGEGSVAYWDTRHKDLTSKAKAAGHDSIKLIDRGVYGDDLDSMVVALDPKNIRSVNAAFDPAKKDSANLLAGLGGAGILGASMLTPEQVQASEMLSAQDNDRITADEFPVLEGIGGFLEDIETPIPLFEQPLQGLGSYLRHLGEPRSLKQRVLGAIDASPI